MSRGAPRSGGGALRFWRLVDGEPLGPATVVSDAATALASSPAGPAFAVAAVSELLVYRGWLEIKPVWRFKGEGIEFDGLAFSPDGKLIATCGEDEFIRLWDAETGAKVGKRKPARPRRGAAP